jgi:hypothetical protein
MSLDYFRAFGPAYAARTGAAFDYDRDYAQRYHAIDPDVTALRADADRLASVGESLTDVVVNLRNRGDGVFGAWEGGSADTARTRFQALLAAGADLRAQFTDLAVAITEVTDSAVRIARDKADAVAGLHTTHVGGRTAAEVAYLVKLAPRLTEGDAADDELAEAARLTGGTFVRRTPATVAQLATAADQWLAQTFVPDFEWRASRFADLCASAEEELASAWHTLSTALSAVRADQCAAIFAPLGEGAAVGADAMRPQAFHAPAAPVAVPTSAVPTTPTTTQNVFGGLPFFAPPAAGGDQERKRLDLPLGVPAFADLATQDEPVLVLGAPQDDEPKPISADEDLW